MVSVTTLLALVSALTAVPVVLDRQDREDTIFVLQGEKAQLDRFRREVGEQWTGGILISQGSSENSLRYWAYSDRTAAEARAFIMPAIFSGLSLEMEDYEEAASFPTERETLDRIAADCGATTDPFFVTPLRTIEIATGDQGNRLDVDCLTKSLGQLDARWSLSSHRDEEQE